MSTHLIIGDIHSHYQHNNERAGLLSRLINDVKPDTVICMGDLWDMPSLSSYDKGQRSFAGRTYRADINAGLDFNYRLFDPLRRKKKKLPRFVFLEGNHEHRIEKALDLSPELSGTISFSDFDLGNYYDDVVRYSGKHTPGVIEIDGITYSHYLISGIMGRPVGGEHPAYSLISKQFTSCTTAHSHLLDYCIRTDPFGRRIMGLVAGSFIDYNSDWAGEQQKLWWSGIVICSNITKGQYDLKTVSMEALRDAYL